MNGPSGLLLADKPAGLTSFQTVAIVRGALARAAGGRRPRVGHAGSLDPLATGLLVVMTGAATRLSPFLVGLDKSYRLVARFGAGTDTLDADGLVDERRAVPADPAALAAALPGFIGEQAQVPPAYSALKRGGERLYRLARSGRPLPELEPRRVRIDRLELGAVRWGVEPGPPGDGGDAPPLAPDGHLYEAELVCDCGSGTYVRALVRDLAAALGTIGHVRALRRERVGPFGLGESLGGADLRDGSAVLAALRPPAVAVAFLPAVVLRSAEAHALRAGGLPDPAWIARLSADPWEDPKSGQQWWRLLDEAGGLVAVVVRAAGGGAARAAVVLAQAADAGGGS